MSIIYKINRELKSRIPYAGKTVKAIDKPLYQKQNQLLYKENEPLKFEPDDAFELITGHLRTGGRKNNSANVWDAWTHEVELIAIGSHMYLDAVIKSIEDSGGKVTSYDLKGWNIWKQYFGMEEYPENQLFTVKYTTNGSFEDVEEDWCEVIKQECE